MRAIIVIGTDTGVGKTTFAATLARSFRCKGIDVGVMKPFATSTKEYSDQYRSEDTAILADSANTEDQDNEINPFFYPIPVSPYVATLITGKTPIAFSTALRCLENIAAKHDLLIIEGIGGLMVPLTEKETFADFAKIVNVPVIVVATSKLGTLNHMLLTVHASRSYGLKIAGIVLNFFPLRASIIDRQLVEAVKKLTNVELLCVISKLSREKQKHLKLDDVILNRILSCLSQDEHLDDKLSSI
jgi:dethiobiotin synthetase